MIDNRNFTYGTGELGENNEIWSAIFWEHSHLPISTKCDNVWK